MGCYKSVSCPCSPCHLHIIPRITSSSSVVLVVDLQDDTVAVGALDLVRGRGMRHGVDGFLVAVVAGHSECVCVCLCD